MKEINKDHLCPVCGFDIYKCFGVLPWQNDNPSWDICPSCGIEYGYQDMIIGNIKKKQEIYNRLRENWIKGGMKWWGRDDDKNKPKNWDSQKQLNMLLELEK